MKQKTIKHVLGAFLFSCVFVSVVSAATGKELAESRKKGNCLACHMIIGANLPGNIAPPLIAMKARFPNKADLRAQIADARVKVPNTIMLPFGPHEIMSAEEIDKVTDYIYSL